MIESLLCFLATLILNVLGSFVAFPAWVYTVLICSSIVTGILFVAFVVIKIIKAIRS